MRDLGREADDLGAVLSNTEIEELATAAEEIEKLKAAFSGLAAEIAKNVAPILIKVAKSISGSVKEINRKADIRENAEAIEKLKESWRDLGDEAIKLEGKIKNYNGQVKQSESMQAALDEMTDKTTKSYKQLSGAIKNADDNLAKSTKSFEDVKIAAAALEDEIELLATPTP